MSQSHSVGKSRRTNGQVVILVTLALFAMFGLIGLVVDFGWSYFVRKTARSAADAAALTGAREALANVSGNPPYTCGVGLVCQPDLVDCPNVTGNLLMACNYAQQNGFSTAGRRRVRIQADVAAAGCDVSSPPNCVPTAPGVVAFYWVRVVTVEQVPQLFSAVLGNTQSEVAADATGALVNSVALGSLILLDRNPNEGLSVNGSNRGVNLMDNGGPNIIAPGGILMASTANGTDNWYSGSLQGNSAVQNTSFTFVRGSGVACAANVVACGTGWGTSSWINLPTTGVPDVSYFQDPYRGKGQPPIILPTNLVPVLGGTLNTSICPGKVCPPGIYYSVGPADGCKTGCVQTANGHTIVVNDDFTFGNPNGMGFDGFIFFGGMSIGQAKVTFGPGMYVMAGTEGTQVFNTDNKALLTGGTAENSDAGRMFLLTDATYSWTDSTGASRSLADVGMSLGLPLDWQLTFGAASFKAGQNEGSGITLYGLNSLPGSSLPSQLDSFAPMLIWQDQRNSNVVYTPAGQIYTGACADGTTGTLNSPCMNPYNTSRAMEIWAGQRNHFGGVIYQPRGSWAVIQGSPGYSGPLRIVTGQMILGGNGSLTLTSPVIPITTLTAALVH